LIRHVFQKKKQHTGRAAMIESAGHVVEGYHPVQKAVCRRKNLIFSFSCLMTEKGRSNASGSHSLHYGTSSPHKFWAFALSSSLIPTKGPPAGSAWPYGEEEE